MGEWPPSAEQLRAWAEIMDRVVRREKEGLWPIAEAVWRMERERPECACRWWLDEADPRRRARGLAELIDSWPDVPAEFAKQRRDALRLLLDEAAAWKRKEMPLHWRRVTETVAGDAEARAALISRIHTAQHLDEVDGASRRNVDLGRAQMPAHAEMKQLRAAARAGARERPLILATIERPKGSLFTGPLQAWISPEELAKPPVSGPRSDFDTPTEVLMDYFALSLAQRISHAAALTSDVLQWFIGRSRQTVRPQNIRQTWARRRADRSKAPVQTV